MLPFQPWCRPDWDARGVFRLRAFRRIHDLLKHHRGTSSKEARCAEHQEEIWQLLPAFEKDKFKSNVSPTKIKTLHRFEFDDLWLFRRTRCWVFISQFWLSMRNLFQGCLCTVLHGQRIKIVQPQISSWCVRREPILD